MRTTETDLAFAHAFSPSKATPSLRESVDYQFAYDQLYREQNDSYGNWRPAQVIGSRDNRVQGKNLYTAWSDYDLVRQVNLARTLDACNPIAQGAVNKLVSFVLQSGAQYKIVPKSKNIKPPEKYLVSGQDVMDEWQDAVKWRRKEKEHVRCAIVEGEILLHKGRSGDGEPTIRRPEPEQLQNPVGMTQYNGWRMGIQHEVDDVCQVLAYNINWKLGVVGEQQPFGTIVPARQIIHLKRNVVESVARGVSDFFSNADDLEKIDRALDAIGAGTIARAKIAYFRTHKDALPGAVQNFANANATGTFYNPITQRTENKFVPTDAAIADVPDTVGVETMPTGNTQESIEAVNLLIRLTIANRWDMPEFIASSDASNNNYASILVSGSPFVIAIRQNQSDFADVWRDCMNWILTVRMAQGILPIDFFEYCKVEVTLPDPTVANELEAEQIRDIRFRNRILSPQTYSAQARLNYDDELVNRREAEANDPALAMDGMPQVDANGEPVKKPQSKPVKESLTENVVDASGHAHVGKGSPQGGQFTGKGGKFSDDNIAELAKRFLDNSAKGASGQHGYNDAALAIKSTLRKEASKEQLKQFGELVGVGGHGTRNQIGERLVAYVFSGKQGADRESEHQKAWGEKLKQQEKEHRDKKKTSSDLEKENDKKVDAYLAKKPAGDTVTQTTLEKHRLPLDEMSDDELKAEHYALSSLLGAGYGRADEKVIPGSELSNELHERKREIRKRLNLA